MGTRKAFHNLSRSRQYYHRKQLLDLLGNENEPEHPFGNGAQHGRHADSDSDSDEAVQPPRQRRRNHVECDADQVGQQRGNEDGEGQGDASENQQSDTDSDISLEDPVEEPQPQQQRNDVILSDNEGDHEDGGSADEVQGDANQNEENHSSSSENENNDEETENEGSDTEVDDDEETENEGSDTEDDDDEETENEGSENGDEAEEVQNVNNGNLFNPDGGNGNRLNPNMPFYHGAPLTMGESLLLILTMVLKHNITGTCLADLLTLIHLHCIRQGLKKVSLYKFRKFFSISKEPIIKHFFCSKCMIPLADVDAVCGTCPPQKRKSYFLEMDIGSQLQHLYLRNDFHGMLQHRFNRNRPAGIADIYDGQLYKAQVENGFLSNANNISFSWYTDGVIVYKSSQISIWPLYLTINELPYHQRIKKENTILAGLWFGPKKPSANYFVRSLRNQFQTLYHGKEFSLHNGNIINVRAILLAGVCDLVAKANFLNMEAHNAVHGCPNCLIATRDVLTRNETHTRAYPYVPNPRMRTVEEFTRSARNALNLGEPVNGVKGPCALSKIMPDFLLGTAIDPMHGIYGGVFKKIMTMCFSEDFAGCPFSLSLVTNIVDQRLLSIKPPKFIHRMPRSVKEICHWKTSELKTFFFFYALPVLSGIMRADWYENLTCLITAVTLLNSDDITQIMFNNAKTLLKKFVREFEQLYGIEYCSLNVHQLLHIPSCVSNLGNLWVFSCFPYEDLNGKFVKLVHGQTNVDSQIVASHALILKSKRKFDALPHGEVRDFCHGRKKMVKLIEMLFDGCYSVGKYNTLAEIPGFIRDALRAANLNFNRVMAYKRLLKDKKIYVSETYNRDVETVSSYVAYSENNDLLFGSINTFLKLTNCECLNNCLCPGEHFAILNIVVTEAQFHATGDRGLQIVLPHIFKCHRANVYVCIPVSILKTVCMYMSVENKSYIAHPVNSMEQE